MYWFLLFVGFGEAEGTKTCNRGEQVYIEPPYQYKYESDSWHTRKIGEKLG